mmetsp:Transcript_3448/g.13337  ORF Transcript_3448/g.13337 Transcript_3448/m.13337 type:complete len:183 (+) Transcript_3448:1069-1617(+)
MIVYCGAGTGKSFIFGGFLQWLDDEYGEGTAEREVAIVAPTACAAKNAHARGTTIQRGVGVPFKDLQKVYDLGENKLEALQDTWGPKLHCFVHEYGMVGARLFGAIHVAMNQIKTVQPGSSTILGGQSVVAEDEERTSGTGSPRLFSFRPCRHPAQATAPRQRPAPSGRLSSAHDGRPGDAR